MFAAWPARVKSRYSPRLIEQVYGHPSADAARERLKRAYGENVVELRDASKTQATGGGAS